MKIRIAGLRLVLPTLAFIALAIVYSSATPQKTQETIRNPLLLQRADPYVYLHTDRFYYFCASVPEYDRIEIAKAKSVEGLRNAVPLVVWRWQKRGRIEDRNFWAPELHFIDGAWFIYYAAGTSRSPYDVRIMILENDSADPMSGSWIDRGRLDTGKNTLSLDATTFALRGSRYLIWGQRLTKSDKSSMDLYIAKMKDPLTLSGKASMIGRADQVWEMRDPANLKMQGPAVLLRNGRVFIAYSSNATDARYATGMMEAKDDSDLLDPASWKKRPGPILESDPAVGVYGPGHNSFTTSPDGSIDYIVYHARDYEKIQGLPILDPNRQTRVQAFGWDYTGEPVFGKLAP